MSYIGRGLPNLRSNAEFSYTASAGQTLFVVPITYTPGNISVFHNGRRVGGFTATDGATVLLNSAATLGDEIVIIVQSNFAVVGAYTKTENDGLFAKKDGSNMATPTQFDNDLSLATTEFVQRALGNRRGFIAYDTDRILLASDAGRFIHLAGAGTTFTTTLPPLSSVPDGSSFLFVCTTVSPGQANIIPAVGDYFIRNDGTTGTSPTVIALSVGQTLELIKLPTGWMWVNGSKLIPTSSYFGAVLASSGYQKLPSGLIVQWGVISTSASADVTATFPIAFPGGLLQVAFSSNDVGANFASGYGGTASSVKVNKWSVAGARVAGSVTFIAIGY